MKQLLKDEKVPCWLTPLGRLVDPDDLIAFLDTLPPSHSLKRYRDRYHSRVINEMIREIQMDKLDADDKNWRAAGGDEPK